MKFFISYSRSVRPNVIGMIELLRAKGHQVWWDADIPPIAPWWGTIIDQIGRCEVFVFVISDKSLQSPYCMAELKYATDRNRPILPFIIDDTKRETIPPEVTPKLNQWLEYKGDIDETTQEIILAASRLNMRHYIDNPTAPRPPKPSPEGHITTLIKQFHQAVMLAENGHFEEAVRTFREVEALDRDKWGEGCRGWIIRLGAYSEIAELAENPSTLRMALIRWADFSNQYSDAEWFDPFNIQTKIKKLEKPTGPLSPLTVDDYYERALKRPKHDYDLKIADYTAVIRLDPQHAEAHNNRGLCYKAKGEYDLAIADYTEAIRLNPEYSAAYNHRGNSYNAQGKYDLAIADYNEAIRLNPEYASAYLNRGMSYDDKKEYDKAIADYSEAIRLNPKSVTAYVNRGFSHDDRREYDQAIADYNEAIRLNPRYAAAYVNRGVSYYAKKDYDRAIADYNEALLIDPNVAHAVKNRQLALDAKKKQGL